MIRDFQYFTLAPLIDESTQQYIFEGGIEAVGDASSLPAVNLEYRFVYDSENEENGPSEWQTYSVGDTISNTTDSWFGVLFRNTSGNFTSSSDNYYHIKSTYAFDAGGKIMSLINYTDESATLPDYAFVRLFSETQIHDAHEIIIPDKYPTFCYYYMFAGCSTLTNAPAELPSTFLGSYCYYHMFENCTSLTIAPALPAQVDLFDSCCGGMFYGCSNLLTAPELPAKTLASFCYSNMFGGCTSLTTAPALPATTLTNYCYNGMFEGCTSLTAAPALPATSLADSCYRNMFNNCTSLTTAPALPATTLADGCYSYMFADCPKIDRIVWKSTTIPSSTYCSGWLTGTSSSGKFEYTDPTLDVASITRDNSGVPAGWSISLLSQETKLLLKINNASVNNISLLGKKIASLSINGKKVKSSSAA